MSVFTAEDLVLLNGLDDEEENPYITHYITPLTQEGGGIKRFIAFDSEDDSKGHPTIVDFFDGDKHVTFHDEDPLYLEKAVRWIYDNAKKGDVFVAHNLEYDINNVFKWCEWRPIAEMSYASRLITATLRELEGVEMWDSFNLYPTSLKNLAKVVGLVKGDFEEARASRHTDILYCQDDTTILWTFMDRFATMVKEKIGTNIRPTVGATAMRAWRGRFLKKEWPACSLPQCLDAYYGGRTEAFFIGETKDIVVADVNSMYPTMMTKPFPDCRTLEESSIETHQYGVGWFRIQVPTSLHIPSLPVRYEKRLFFPTGEVEGWWTYEEVFYAMSLGCEVVEERDGIGTNATVDPFSEYVEVFYALRKIAKENPDMKFENVLYKLLLNNLYGKMCQHTDRMVVSADEPKGRNWQPVRLLGPFGVWKQELIEPLKTTNYLWGAYITAYSRVHLHSILKDVHDAGHHVLYCDTDSVMYERAKGCKIPYEVNEELGGLDEEHYVEGKFITAKGYWMKDKEGEVKLACKGVPTDMGLEFLETGIARFERPVKLRESLVQDLEANVWREVEKTAQTQYLKRKVYEDGKTRAWRMDELDDVISSMEKI